jgi:lipopolysaccharide biosynthesis protein
MKNNIKTIAFYLPQYHTIPENDEAYGIGFTEWTNTKKATPLYDGHHQPRTPKDKNYYCLLDDGVMESQAVMAKKYGVYGFCYYHYYFKDGKKLLEKPLEMMLNNPSIDIPFCLCWANENWSKRWDGGNNEVIAVQNYDDLNGLKEHLDYLCNFFRDKRYIYLDDMPVLVIYRPEIIPNLRKYMSIIREQINKNGFKGVKLICQYPVFYFEKANLDLFDYYIQFQPAFVQQSMAANTYSNSKKIGKFIKTEITKLGFRDCARYFYHLLKKSNSNIPNEKLVLRNYEQEMNEILNFNVLDKKLVAGIFTDWDNTPRRKSGTSYIGSTPEKFEKYMKLLINKVNKEYSTDFIFVNAWNEWGEGAYLEPDEKFGYAYLEALRNALYKEG